MLACSGLTYEITWYTFVAKKKFLHLSICSNIFLGQQQQHKINRNYFFRSLLWLIRDATLAMTSPTTSTRMMKTAENISSIFSIIVLVEKVNKSLMYPIVFHART